MHELTYEMKNGLPGTSLTPIGISIAGEHIPLVEKYLAKEKETWPERQLPPVFVRAVSPGVAIKFTDKYVSLDSTLKGSFSVT